jgi:signal transduction histidine kinase
VHFLSHVHFFSCICYSFLALRILFQFPRQQKNYIAGISFFCFSLWSLSFVFIHHHATPRSVAALWLNISSIGGLLYPTILLWFSMNLLGRTFRFLSWSAAAISLALILVQFSSHSVAVIAGPNPAGPGWEVAFLDNFPNVVYAIYTGIVVPAAFAFVIIVVLDTKRLKIERKRAALVLLGATVTLVTGWAFMLFAGHRGWSPSLFLDSFFLPCALGIYVAIKKFHLFGPTLETTYRGIVGSMAQAVILVDSGGVVTYANNAAHRLFRWARPLHNRRIAAVLDMAGDSHAELCGPDDYQNKSVKLEAGDGSRLDLLVSRTSPGETAGGCYYLFSDITRHTRAQQELERVERLRTLEVFAGGIAHDLNNLLTGIVGYLDLAAANGVSARQRREYLMKARNMFPNIVSLTGQLLTRSKWGYRASGPTDSAPVLREAAQLALSGSGVSLTCDFEKDLHPVKIDQAQLTQIINNLVVNARQALGTAGTVRVTARNESLSDSPREPVRDWVRITVEDNGCGIPEALKKRIFEPFFTTKDDGSGLGLATTRSIVEKQGGTIDVASTPGAGTMFILRLLPAEKSETHACAAAEQLSIWRGEREKVLVLDDEPGIQMLLTDMLEMAGCCVVAVPHGEAALDAAKSAAANGAPFTLGILDLTIPGAAGALDIAPALKELNAGMTLALSTGYSDRDLSACQNAQAFSAVLYKPFTFGELKQLVHSLRDGGHASRTPLQQRPEPG